jgi:hypothetical protein
MSKKRQLLLLAKVEAPAPVEIAEPAPEPIVAIEEEIAAAKKTVEKKR